MNIQFISNSNQVCQIWVSKEQSFVFGELFHLKFMILYDDLLKNIGDEFF